MSRPRTGFAFLDAGLEQPGSVLAFAHRGGARHPDLVGLENTVAAFAHATALGYRYLETDVHTTREGVLVALHDSVLDRVAGTPGSVAELTKAELVDLRIGGREAVPTMAELLERFPTSCFNIDLKADASVVALADLLRATGSEDRVCVGSFSERRLTRFRRLAGPRVATSRGPVGVALSRIAPTGRRRRRAGRGVALQVPARVRGLRVVTGKFVDDAHAAGRPVHVWTVDDPDQMHELLDLGVDGLMTDRTDLLREVLLGRGQWMGDPS